MKASCYFRAPTTSEHFTSGFTSGLSLRNTNTFFKTMAGSVRLVFLQFVFKNLYLYRVFEAISTYKDQEATVKGRDVMIDERYRNM